MEETKFEQAMLKEFAEFIDAKPVAPGESADEVILRMVGKDLRPAFGKSIPNLLLSRWRPDS